MGINFQQLHFMILSREILKPQVLQAFVEQEAIFHPAGTEADLVRCFGDPDILLNELIFRHPVARVAPRFGLGVELIADGILFHQTLVQAPGRVDSHMGRLLAAHKSDHTREILLAEGDQVQILVQGRVGQGFHPRGRVNADEEGFFEEHGLSWVLEVRATHYL